MLPRAASFPATARQPGGYDGRRHPGPGPPERAGPELRPRQPERAALEARLKELAAEPLELPMTIGGEPIELTSHTAGRGWWAGCRSRKGRRSCSRRPAITATAGRAADTERRYRVNPPDRCVPSMCPEQLADRSTSGHQAGEESGQTSHRGRDPDHRRAPVHRGDLVMGHRGRGDRDRHLPGAPAARRAARARIRDRPVDRGRPVRGSARSSADVPHGGGTSWRRAPADPARFRTVGGPARGTGASPDRYSAQPPASSAAPRPRKPRSNSSW